MACIVFIGFVFGAILILAAIAMILEGLESGDKRKVVGGAALGLGTAAGLAGLKRLSDKQKAANEAKQLQAGGHSGTDIERR